MAINIRIIRDLAGRSPAFNMAADRLLLLEAPKNDFLTIRLYRWEPPTISIGYMQHAQELLNLQAMRDASIEWVRRPTGGRAVFHKDDLTYSAIFSQALDFLGATISQTNGVISGCLMRGLTKCGITCESSDSEPDGPTLRRQVSLPCFASPNRAEIMVGGRKLIGSAQKRTATAVLQHGSLPLGTSFRLLPIFQNIDTRDQEKLVAVLERKCTCLQEVAPGVGLQTLIEGLITGFCQVLDGYAFEQPWRESELERIAVMCEEGQD